MHRVHVLSAVVLVGIVAACGSTRDPSGHNNAAAQGSGNPPSPTPPPSDQGDPTDPNADPEQPTDQDAQVPDAQCGTAPSCYEDGVNCTNGKDDDGDGLVDCADPDCAPVIDGGILSGPLPLTVTGDTTGHGNDTVLGPALCTESPVNFADDVTYSFTTTTAGTYHFEATPDATTKFGIVLDVTTPTCGTPSLACQAYDVPAGIDVALDANVTVLVTLDPFKTPGSPYVLTISMK